MDGVYAPEAPPDHMKYDFLAIRGQDVWGVISGRPIPVSNASWSSPTEFAFKQFVLGLVLGVGRPEGILLRYEDVPLVLFKKLTYNLDPPDPLETLGKFKKPGSKTYAWISGVCAELFVDGVSTGVEYFTQVTQTGKKIRMESKNVDIVLDATPYNPTVAWTVNTVTYDMVRTGQFDGFDAKPTGTKESDDTPMALILGLVIAGLLILN